METEKTLPFAQEDLLKDLPERRSYAEISGQYGALLSECVQEYGEVAARRSRPARLLADLTVSLARNLKDGFGKVAKWVDTLIPDFDLAPAPDYAYATRAIGTAGEGAAAARLSFEKPGRDGSLKLDLELAPSGANLQARLLDDDGNAVRPFFLTVTDADSGEELLSRREFTVGAANLKGVKRGRYVITASAGRRACDFSLTVE